MSPPARGFRYGQEHPVGYLITFRTYGTWLHGDERGSVDRGHNLFGTPLLPSDAARKRMASRRMTAPAVKLAPPERGAVHRVIEEVCVHRGWELHALNIRSNHVHVVVSGIEDPEAMMNSFKAWATRRLRESGLRSAGCRLWGRHGSTEYLWTAEQLAGACNYVVDQQDEPR
jgi:REP element-mobilizing transposase RayT